MTLTPPRRTRKLLEGNEDIIMRCYFHLTNGDETIRDDHGIEVSDRESARAMAIQAIVELRAVNPSRAAQGAGWTLVAVDTAGAILFTFPLDTRLPS
jgi:hypothetical protein